MPVWIVTQSTFHSKQMWAHQYTRRRPAILRLMAMPVLALMLVGVMCDDVRARATNIQISVLSLSPPRIRIEGNRFVATRIWSFRNAYAGLLGLGERIENLTLKDVSGVEVPVRKLASGEYEAARDAIRWSCDIRLEPSAGAADSANASWLAGERGFLMLGDLFPLEFDGKPLSVNTSMVRIKLPPAWTVYSSESKQSDGEFEVSDVNDAVFFIGKGLRERHERLGRIDASLVTEGTWAFSDQEVMTMVSRILKEYTTRVGVSPGPRVTILLSHFPSSVGAERWAAETRRNTVTLLSGESPSVVAGLSQLSTPLTHELFHLWVPNGIRLAGNYDWFYEGFTLYEALCVAQRLGFLTFQDYLNALGRAYDAYSFSNEARKLSLIEASMRRWTRPTTLVYQKGMLVAFLYDLSLRKLTHGKRTLDDVYRALFRDSTATGTKREGNDVVLGILKDQDKLQEFVRKYVENSDDIDLQAMVSPFGLTVERIGGRTRIVVSEKISSQERDLLRAFGYNNETRRTGR